MGRAVRVLHQVDEASGITHEEIRRERDGVLVEIALRAFRRGGPTKGGPRNGAPGSGRARRDDPDGRAESQ